MDKKYILSGIAGSVIIATITFIIALIVNTWWYNEVRYWGCYNLLGLWICVEQGIYALIITFVFAFLFAIVATGMLMWLIYRTGNLMKVGDEILSILPFLGVGVAKGISMIGLAVFVIFFIMGYFIFGMLSMTIFLNAPLVLWGLLMVTLIVPGIIIAGRKLIGL